MSRSGTEKARRDKTRESLGYVRWHLPLLFLVSTAAAQTGQSPEGTDVDGSELENIVVTASRIQRAGFEAPTPTTVIDSDDLQRSAVSNLADYLNAYVPSFQATITPSTNINTTVRATGNSPDLRALGPERTLVLVNGRRHVATSPAGTVDIDLIPATLIERVEVVTGGASAQYGSDAVAGVVNLLFRDEYDGLDVSLQAGASERGDNEEVKLSLGFGTPFLDDRAQFMIGAEYVDRQGIPNQGDRSWGRNGYQLVSQATTVPQRQLYPGVNRIATPGGVITDTALRGTTFGPGSTVGEPFQFGTQLNSSGQVGGSGTVATVDPTIVTPSERWNVMARVTYEVADDISAFAELSYADSQYSSDLLVTGDGLINFPYTIQSDNAFLPDSIRDMMLAGNIDSFTLSRIDYDLGTVSVHNGNETQRYVAGLEGDLGREEDWRWEAYWQRGENDYRNAGRNVPRFGQIGSIPAAIPFVFYAVDAVDQGGQVVCRDAVARANGCVPVNVIGEHEQSAEALAFISRDIHSIYHLREDVFAATIQGDPFSTWAGPVSIAAGAEYRDTTLTTEVDPLSAQTFSPDPLTAARAGTLLTAAPFAIQQAGGQIGAAETDVKEAFFETIVPLAHGLPLAELLEFNGAFRWTEYSTSGSVETWKLGFSWMPVEQLRLRGTRSRDIRAASIFQNFAGGPGLPTAIANIADPELGGVQYQATISASGNPNLLPESADTVTLGVVYEPDWLSGFQGSVDYYDIEIDDAINRLGGQDAVDRCFSGEEAVCSIIERDPATNRVTLISAGYANFENFRARGLDFEFVYSRAISDGEMTLRLLANHALEYRTADELDGVGSLGQSSVDGVPEWRGSLGATFTEGRFSTSLFARYIGSGVYDKNLPPEVMAPYSIPSVTYLDATISYDLLPDRRLHVFANVRNLLDKDPPVVPSTSNLGLATNTQFYDVVGRMFTVGVRYSY